MIQEEKSRLRARLLLELKNFSPAERVRQNREIEKKFLALLEFAAARTIGFFASEEFEVSTDELITKSLAAGKRVCLPRIKKYSVSSLPAGRHGIQHSELEFHEIKNLTELEVGEFGIRAPREDSPKVAISKIQLLAVPGLAFTKNGERLGQGGGFFDRVLKKFEGVSVGLAFDFQILKEVPMESFDQKISKILVGE
ncbi:MAG: 5-formyltetrahydrofolate cyclo-ligase [Patescibacteria group bacterium]